MNPHLISRRLALRQQGYTLVEILVALFVGIFLLSGLFTILQNTRRTSGNQSALAQLQDEQRMAMSLLNDVIQNAGYFDPNTTTSAAALPAASALPATGYAMASSQGLSGWGTATTGDVIVARYASNGTDGIINCNGATATGAQTNTFYIQSTASGPELYCSLDSTKTNGIPLVTGVKNMQIFYGVSSTAGANNVDTYLTGAQVQASSLGWAAVTSVRVTLTFVNPLSLQAGYPGTSDVYLTRVIPLQGRTGVIATAL